MYRNRIVGVILLAGAFAASSVFAPCLRAQSANQESSGTAEFVVTASAKGSRPIPMLERKDLTVQVRNRPAEITSLEPARGENSPLQLVFLFDDSARSYLSLQIPSLQKFIQSMPPSVEVAVAYMGNGRAVMAQTLTTDHALAAKSLRLTSGIPGISASPYFCLSDLAKHWPAAYQAGTRRVVFMVTNGEDPYYHGGDLQDPYVGTAIQDSQKAGLLVYSIYFRNVGFSGQLRTLFGQSYLLRTSQETGGESFAQGMISPVSFDPFLNQFRTALKNQYLVSVSAQGKGLERLRVKSNLSGVKLATPSAVFLGSR